MRRMAVKNWDLFTKPRRWEAEALRYMNVLRMVVRNRWTSVATYSQHTVCVC